MQKVEISLYANQPKEAKPVDVRERVKTFEDACREIDCYPDQLVVSGVGLIDGDVKALAALQKLFIIAKALNEGWTPDWNNGSQYKYYPWFDLRNGFAFFGYDDRIRISRLGSRLCFKSRELAEYAGKQFLQLYEQAMVI